MNNTAFGGDVPTVPQWSGPPPTIVRVQAMLYASLSASLFSAFLAMLGKQWLNRYVSTDMRGTAIERSQSRQRKLNGVVTWHFDHIMEALPLMLQFALLLLGCALSLYIWRIDTTVASVVLGVTLFGLISYASVIIAGTVSVSCPYQTPGAQVLRYLWQKVPNHPTFFTKTSQMQQQSVTHPGTEQPLDREATRLDFLCISWMLRTSLDRVINQLTLKFLASILVAPGFKTILVADCFKMLTSSVSVTNDNRVVVLRGSEQLAETAATCLLGALSHSLVTNPKSKILKDVHQEFDRFFLPMVNLQSLPFHPTISAVRNLFNGQNRPKGLSWEGVDPSAPENIPIAHILVKVAWLSYQRSGLGGQKKKVPRWILRFSFHCLLQHPIPPPSIITDCLLIIAIDLGCSISDGDIRNLDKRCVYLTQLHNLSSSSFISTHLDDIISMIYQQLDQIGGSPDTIQLNRKTIAILSVWAMRFEMSNKPRHFDPESPSTQNQSSEPQGQTHITNSTLGAIYLDALLGCINVKHGQVMGGPVSEQVTRVASLCLLHVLSGVDPIPTAIKDMPQNYAMVIPHHASFEGLLCYHAVDKIHLLSILGWRGDSSEWIDHKPCPQEHVLFTNTLVQVAHGVREYQWKVPGWILRFVLRSLSIDPPPPTPVIVNCLLIIAIDLGCDVSISGTTTLDKRYIHTP